MTRNENFPQLSELDAELFPSNNSDDTTFLYGEKPMTQKFDFNSLQAAEKQQSIAISVSTRRCFVRSPVIPVHVHRPRF